jgi:hypothetical protein
MTGIAEHADRRLDSLAFVVAEMADDVIGMRAVSGSPGDLVAGLVGLFHSALTGWSDAADIEPEQLLDQLRADAVRLRDRY